MESQPNVNPHGSIHNQPRAGACLNCREKKVKCDKLQPCSTCSKKNESSLCLYGIERSEFLAARAEFQALTARRRQLYREEERDFLEDLLGDRDDDEISDADSDYQEVRAVTAKYAEDIIRFRATQREENDNGGGLLRIRSNDLSPEPRRRPRGSQRGVVRGPRKAAQPTGDIKARLSKAYEAFIKTNYDEARDVVEEIIRINAETHEAWQLLASIFTELKDTNNTFKALMIACSMTPKDVNAWIYCAEFGLYQTGSDRDGYIKSVHICYASAIRAAPRKVEARIAQADLRMEYGRAAAALKGYHQALLYSPHNLEILRKLATAYVEYGDNEKARVNDEKPRIQSIEKAKAEYQDSIAHYNKIENLAEPPFGWDDLMVYINLCTDLGHYEEAIKELKSLSRWLIGRGDEKYWDAFTDDDREWDDDDARRKDCPEFQAARYPLYTYGQGLPLEIRVKLGLCRLHLLHYRAALSHFEYLDPCDKTGQGIIFEYADLYRIVADSLYKANFHEQALTFYEPLQTLDGQSTASLQVAMGKCYVKTKNTSKAEECFKVAIRLDKDSKVARLQLANIYEQQNQPERAMLLVQELMSLISGPLSDVVQMRPRLHEASPEPIEEPSKPTKFSKFKRGVQINEADLADFLQLQFNRMRKEHKRMREGDRKATRAWMGAAKELIDDFRGCKPFYPWDKYIRFLGDPGTSQAKESETTMNNEVTEMADRLNLNIGEKTPAVALPVDYRGLKFDTWLDIFLEYAIILAKAGRTGEAYQICEAAKDSVIFYHSRESMFLIHIAWTTCALIANDEESCITVSRFFLRDYQFITDSYRLFGAVARMCQSPISWYNSGPSQKYILRQVKAMDYSLVDDETRARNFAYKGGYSAFDEEHENRIINTDMDTSLLMLYGYVLYTGTSYMYALNYFTRAHALDPNNPAIQLTMALSYIHWALKRQSDNRQYLILQGLSFLLRYYDNRKLSSKVEERQEAHYNVGRAYHLLGLTQISIPYYKRVLEEADHANTSSREDLVVDVAYNLQTIYSAAGNYELARAITDKYLVI